MEYTGGDRDFNHPGRGNAAFEEFEGGADRHAAHLLNEPLLSSGIA
jgi:hypothetical protein